MKRTKALVYLGFLTTLSIVLTRLASIRIPLGGVEVIRIGFGQLPVIMAGIYFGPGSGALVGGLSDFLGFFLNPMGPYLPHFTLAAILHGLLPGLLFHRSSQPLRKRIFWSIAIPQIAVGIFLTSYFLHSIFRYLGTSFFFPPGQCFSQIFIYFYLLLLLSEVPFYHLLTFRFSPIGRIYYSVL